MEGLSVVTAVLIGSTVCINNFARRPQPNVHPYHLGRSATFKELNAGSRFARKYTLICFTGITHLDQNVDAANPLAFLTRI